MLKLSIAIPLYNGAEFVAETIESIIKQERFEEIELIFCDDISSDNSCQIVKKYASKFSNIKLFNNEVNLGMDKNFEKVVTHCKGEFFWFSGQDDIFKEGAIAKVLDVIDSYIVGFIYLNFSQHSHNLNHVITPKVINISNDVYCENKDSFFSETNLIFPSFLPSFIMRKQVWDSVDKTRFYGSQYVQVGVLLDVIDRINTFIIAQPYVIGRIPDTGWQQDEERKLDIFSGYLEVFHYHKNNNPKTVTKQWYKKVFTRLYPLILTRLIYLKLDNRPISNKVQDRFKTIFNFNQKIIIGIIEIFPRSLLKIMVDLYFKLKKPK